MKKLILLIGLTFSLTMNAQVPTIQWQKTFGGIGSDAANSIQQTTDGGFIVCGRTDSNDGDVTNNHGGIMDSWVIKLSTMGNIQFQKTLGGTNFDNAFSIQQTIDGGYIVAGLTSSTDGDVTGIHGNINSDYWVVKLSNTGTIEWQKTLGGTSTDISYSIQQTNDGGYIVTGYTTSNEGDVFGNHGSDDFWVVKLSTTGTIEWQKTLGGGGIELASKIQQTTDGGYIVTGYTYSNDGDVSGNHGGKDIWVVKLSTTGNFQWQKTLGGAGNEYASSIQQTTDGGYVLAGSTNSTNGDVTGNHGGVDYWVVKFSTSGTIQWQKTLGGTGDDVASSIQLTNDGGYIVAGYTTSTDGDVTSNHGSFDTWLVKLSITGVIQWQKTFGGTDYDNASSIQQTTDGGYIVAGYTTSNDGDVTGNHGGNTDLWVIKLSPDTLSPSITNGFCQTMSFSNLSNMPTNRGLIASATDGSNIYVCNGMSLVDYSTTQIEKYNITTNTWSTFSNTNTPLRYASAEVVGNKLYVFNGRASSSTYNNKMEVIDLTSGVVTYSSDNPSPVYSAGSSVWNGKIYSFGGIGSAGYSNKLYVFDPILQTWTQLANMPQAKETKGEIINGKLYVIGGFNTASLTSIDCYDILTNTWSHLMDMPASNSANATSAYQNKIWVVGDYTNETFVGYYDVLTNQFVSIQSNIIARRHAGAIALNNNLYAFGGDQTAFGSSSLNSLQVANITDFTNVPNVGYTSPQTYTIGTAINPLTPINTSGSCGLIYSITPALPSGLTLDTATGIISGTPVGTSPVTSYSITACNSFVCVTSTLVLSTTTLGTTEFSTTSLKLYPNPTQTLLNIQTSTGVVLDKISITDLTGKTVLEQTQNTNQVSVEKLARGVYILNGYSEGSKFQEKFIKQ